MSLAVKNVDLSEMRVIVYLRQKNYLIERDDVEVSFVDPNTNIDITLTQEETLALCAGNFIKVQVRFIDPAGNAGATEIKKVLVDEILKNEVIRYE